MDSLEQGLNTAVTSATLLFKIWAEHMLHSAIKSCCRSTGVGLPSIMDMAQDLPTVWTVSTLTINTTMQMILTDRFISYLYLDKPNDRDE